MVDLSTLRHIHTPTSSMFQQDIIRRLADWRENVRLPAGRQGLGAALPLRNAPASKA